MPWTEFITLVSGLMTDTPLGQIVSIRSETDRDTIKEFTSSQRDIYDKWQTRTLVYKKSDNESMEKQQHEVEIMVAALFGRG